MIQGHYHELFAAQCQPHLLKKQFNPTQEQLDFAKLSLIEKHKIANGIPQLLLCRKGNPEEEDLLTVNEKSMIEGGKKKYLDFVRKNYNQKITEELTSLNKLRGKIKEYESKTEEQRRQGRDEKDGKNLMEQELSKKKRKNEEVKATAGKKKVKTQQAPKKAKQKKGTAREEVNIRPPEPVAQQNEESPVQEAEQIVSESLGLDLLNSLSEEDFDHYQGQEQ